MVRNLIDRLFNKRSFFSICELDEIMEITRSRKTSKAYKQLHALHCMHYADMDDELKELLPHLVAEALRYQPSVKQTETALRGVRF